MRCPVTDMHDCMFCLILVFVRGEEGWGSFVKIDMDIYIYRERSLIMVKQMAKYLIEFDFPPLCI